MHAPTPLRTRKRRLPNVRPPRLPQLDAADRAALAHLGVYVALVLLVLAIALLGALTLGMCVRLFLWAS